MRKSLCTCHDDPESSYSPIRRPLPEEEIHEIQDKEYFLIQQLEELLAKFEKKHAHGSIAILLLCF